MDLSKRIKRHVTAIPHDFRAICHPGFEKTCEAEFRTLGFTAPIKVSFGALDFTARLDEAWKLSAFSRTCTRIVMRIESFSAENFGRFEKKSQSIPWELFFSKNSMPRIHVTSKKSRLYHTDAVSERIGRIVLETLEKNGENFGKPFPQNLFVHFENDRCTLSADLAGVPLYKRGFERHVEAAPIRDTLAASILLEARLPCAAELFDPMAGSGTFSSEAALLLAGANLWKTRSFALQNAPSFRPNAWNFMTRNTPGLKLFPDLKIHAGDISGKAFETLLYNLEQEGAAPFLCGISESALEISRSDFFDLPKAKASSLLVLNPPYGKRISADIPRLYREIGKKIRSDFSSSNAAVIAPNAEAEKALALSPKRKIRTLHGGLDVCVLFRFA